MDSFCDKEELWFWNDPDYIPDQESGRISRSVYASQAANSVGIVRRRHLSNRIKTRDGQLKLIRNGFGARTRCRRIDPLSVLLTTLHKTIADTDIDTFTKFVNLRIRLHDVTRDLQ